MQAALGRLYVLEVLQADGLNREVLDFDQVVRFFTGTARLTEPAWISKERS